MATRPGDKLTLFRYHTPLIPAREGAEFFQIDLYARNGQQCVRMAVRQLREIHGYTGPTKGSVKPVADIQTESAA